MPDRTVARLFAEKKAKIVAHQRFSRRRVPIRAASIRMKAMRYKERSGTVVGMPGASRISNDDLLTMKCDILVPAALENVITLHNAEPDQGENRRRSRQRSDDSARR